MLQRLSLLAILLGSVLFGPGIRAQVTATGGVDIRIEPGTQVAAVDMDVVNQQGNWYNDDTVHIQNGDIRNEDANGMFLDALPSAVPTNGTVVLQGGVQEMQGNEPIFFQTLRLRGTGEKRMVSTDEFVRDTLDLTDRVLNTQIFTMSVLSPAVDAVKRQPGTTGGYVQSNPGGFLKRAMNNTRDYLFPVGMQAGVQGPTQRFRPLFITPSTAAADSFAVRFFNDDATTEGFDVSNVDPAEICRVNDQFYHQIRRSPGNANNVNVSLFYDAAADGNFDLSAYWDNTPRWDDLSDATSALTVAGVPDNVQTGPINTFGNEAFALAKANPDIDITSLLSSPVCEDGAVQNLAFVTDPPMSPPPAPTVNFTVRDTVNGVNAQTGVAPSSPLAVDPGALGPGGYAVILEVIDPNDPACTASDTAPNFVVAPVPDNVSFTDNAPVCLDPVQTLLTVQGSRGDVTYDWTYSGVANGSANGQQLTLNPTTSGDLTYDVTVTDTSTAANCTAMFNDVIAPAVNDTPSIDLVNTSGFDFICDGESRTLQANGAAGANLEWFLNGNMITPTQPPDVHDASQQGTYSIVATDPATGCQGTDDAVDFDLTTEPNITVGRNIAGPVCEGETVVLNAQPTGPDFMYSWDITFPDGTMQSAGGNSVSLNDSAMVDLQPTFLPCPNFSFDNLTTEDVVVNPLPVASFTNTPPPADTVTLFEENTFTASVANPQELSNTSLTYFWDFDLTDAMNPERTEADPETIWSFNRPGGEREVELVVSTAEGCADTVVRVLYIDTQLGLFIPNAFSPNRDGTNDVFALFGRGIDPSSIQMQIFNRWGEEIAVLGPNDFELNDDTKGWDGTTDDGDPVPEGVYVYTVQACSFTPSTGDCREFVRSGTVTILR